MKNLTDWTNLKVEFIDVKSHADMNSINEYWLPNLASIVMFKYKVIDFKNT